MKETQIDKILDEQPAPMVLRERGFGKARPYGGKELVLEFHPFTDNEEATRQSLIKVNIGKESWVGRAEELQFLLRLV